jgi:hypothetical protein
VEAEGATWGDWTPAPLTWATLTPKWTPVELPARFQTPGDGPWTYAAVSGRLDLPPGGDWAIRIQVSEVSGDLGVVLADTDAQNGRRFMSLPRGDGVYWATAPLAIPKRDGHALILQGLEPAGGAATIHAVEFRRLSGLAFNDWTAVLSAFGKAQAV